MIADDLNTFEPEQRRQALRASRAGAAFKQAVIDKLTREKALLKRLKFAAKFEAYSAEKKSLLDEALDSDLPAVAAEIEAMQTAGRSANRSQPKRERLPANLPRREIRHEPEDTRCGCGAPMQRIGEGRQVCWPRSWWRRPGRQAAGLHAVPRHIPRAATSPRHGARC